MLDHTKKELTFRREMDGEVFSCYAKQLKPDAEIYQIILNKYQLKPEECVFIDDRSENCRGAQEQGIHTICFKDFKQVTADLGKTWCEIKREKSQNRVSVSVLRPFKGRI